MASQILFNTPPETPSPMTSPVLFRTPEIRGVSNLTPNAPKKRKVFKNNANVKLFGSKTACCKNLSIVFANIQKDLKDIKKSIDCIKSTVETILDHHHFNRKREIVEEEVDLHAKGYGLGWDMWLKENPDKKPDARERASLPILYPNVEVKILDYLLEFEDPMKIQRKEFSDAHDLAKCVTSVDEDGNIDCGCVL